MTAKPPAPKSLREYEGKRNFESTPEPRAETPRRSRQGGRRRFVVQKHAASHLHYDFRLEMHDALKSWAVPKGVPYSPDERRLAMATEDHPLDYLNFEGVIPEGQYGGGTVMVWDIGTYELMEGNYYKGQITFFLTGKKLKGEWQLKRDSGKSERGWLLTRVGKALRKPKNEDKSALSGRSMEEIAAAKDAVWHSNRSAQSVPNLEQLPGSPLDFIEPMRAKPVAKLPDEPGWQYEVKLDGYRALAIRTHDTARLLSRRNNDLSARFAGIHEAVHRLPSGCILDGEIVALDEDGRPSFNVLQNYQTSSLPLYFYAFDLLAIEGRDTRRLPLSERRQLLEQIVLRDAEDPLRISRNLHAEPSQLIEAATQQRLEGLIAKRRSSKYESGQRSGAWVKFKLARGQELVIGGYMPSSAGFDSLLAGYYEGERLMFIAKVRNGFTPRTKKQVEERFQRLQTDACPFSNLPERKGARRGEALTAAVMRKCRWLKPALVAHVDFTDWTDANHLRHSRFVALRDDKDPEQVVKEQP